MRNLDGSILRSFLDADGAAVSGDYLAGELGVSRVAIWSRLGRLRSEGFTFEAAPRKGYRLVGMPAGAHPALVEAHLRRLGCEVPCIVLESVDSTNSEAERRLAAGDDAPFAILARRQTAGRGRLGRKWQSDREDNLYLSLAFRPFLPVSRLGPFTVWMGLALCQHLESTHGIRLGLKWPNDLLDDNGRKVAGMLTEARVDSDSVRDLVFGLGLNLAGPGKDWSPELARRAAGLRRTAQPIPDVSAVAANVIAALTAAWERFESGRFSAEFRRLAERHDCIRGQAVTVTLRDQPLSGTADGIGDDGALRLRTKGGKLVTVASGEVTLRT